MLFLHGYNCIFYIFFTYHPSLNWGSIRLFYILPAYKLFFVPNNLSLTIPTPLSKIDNHYKR